MSMPDQPSRQAPQDRSWEDLLDSHAPRDPDEVADAVKASLGIGTRRVRYGDRSELPDIGDLAEGLGLK